MSISRTLLFNKSWERSCGEKGRLKQIMETMRKKDAMCRRGVLLD